MSWNLNTKSNFLVRRLTLFPIHTWHGILAVLDYRAMVLQQNKDRISFWVKFMLSKFSELISFTCYGHMILSPTQHQYFIWYSLCLQSTNSSLGKDFSIGYSNHAWKGIAQYKLLNFSLSKLRLNHICLLECVPIRKIDQCRIKVRPKAK